MTIVLRILFLLILFASSPATSSIGQQPSAPAGDTDPADKPRGAEAPADLRFNFSAATWPDVLEWFAEQADLSLQLDQIPIGTFSFTDPTRSYGISEGLDVINLALMKRGYSLVRRGRMLQVIDLEMDNANKLISEIAELVRAEDLEQRGKTDIVSCVMPLGSLTPDQAREELTQVIGPWGRVIVLDSARQVKVTETAEKLIAIRDLLASAAMADTTVVEIILKHRSSDEILEIARPLLGLEPGETSNEGIRISVGLYGDRIYAAGLPGKTGLLEAIIKKADQPLVTTSAEGEKVASPTLQTHPIISADNTSVFDVLQTLLAGTPEARLSIEPKTNAIIAWARPETHHMIAETIAKLEGRGQEFKVIDLRRLDPAQALVTINKFFGVTEAGGEGPTVDGDPATGKLWVRGTAEQIALVQRLLLELEGSDSLDSLGDKVRMLPYTGVDAQKALHQVQQIWSITGRKNQIRTVAPSEKNNSSDGIPERRVPRKLETSPKDPQNSSDANQTNRTTNHRYTLVSEPIEPPEDDSNSIKQPQETSGETNPSTTISVHGADIIVQFTPNGMMIASEDLEALDAFQSLMESLAEPSTAQADLPTIIWLKYIKADLAAELISSVLGGGETSVASAVDSVTSGFGGGMLGLLGLGGGGGGDGEEPPSTARSIMTTSGSVNIVPDARLNALIIQANPVDLRLIEMILEKVDREESPEDIQTVSRPQLIPVIYQDAADVAEVVKAAFGDRIQGAASSGSQAGPPSPQEFIQALRGKGKSQESKPTSRPNQIGIAVDVKSNSLVVVATPQDFDEVRELVETLDNEGMATEETIITHTMDGSVNPEVLRLALQSILGTEAGSSTTKNGKPTPNSSGTKSESAQAAADIQRRMEFFRAIRDGMGAEGGQAGRGSGRREGRLFEGLGADGGRGDSARGGGGNRVPGGNGNRKRGN